MGFRKPDMKSKKTGLCTESDHGKKKDHIRYPCQSPESAEIEGPAPRPEKEKHGEQKGCSEVGGDEIDPSCPADLSVSVLEHDEKEGGYGHDLPRKKEEQAVGGKQHEDDAAREKLEKEAAEVHFPLPGVMGEVTGAKEGRGHGNKDDRKNEPRREPVHDHMERAGGKTPAEAQLQVASAREHGKNRQEQCSGSGSSTPWNRSFPGPGYLGAKEGTRP